MWMKLYLYWRWIRRSRIRLKRAMWVALPKAVPWSEHAAGDSYPVLTTALR